MKKLANSYEIMEQMIEILNEAYKKNKMTTEGLIQFKLSHDHEVLNCYIKVTKELLYLEKGVVDNPTVSLDSTLYDFLDLASKKLNPIIGVLLRKLKFKGDTSFFKKVLEQKNLFEIEHKVPEDEITKFELDPSKDWEKPKKVLILNGSARVKKGYTEFYLQPFIDGLKECNVEYEVVYTDRINVKNCKGCWHCWAVSPGNCIYDGKDDFNELLEKHENADMIVYALPVYTDGMPASMKNFFDRCVRFGHPYFVDYYDKVRHPRRRIKKQSMVVFAVSGYLEKDSFDALELHFKQISFNWHIPIVKQIFIPGSIYLFNNPLMFKKLNEITESTKKAAIEIYHKGKIDKKTHKKITQDLGKISDYKKVANYFWHDRIKKKENNY